MTTDGQEAAPVEVVCRICGAALVKGVASRNQRSLNLCAEHVGHPRGAPLNELLERRRIQRLTVAARRAAAKTERREKKDRVVARRKEERKVVRQLVKEERKAERLVAKVTGRGHAVKRELARRVLARRHLLPYIMRFDSTYLPGWVHRDLCRRLEKFSQEVAEGKSPRLMIQMPPRHGKSRCASVEFPSWHLGNYPKHEIIETCYGASLAMDFSRQVRERLREDSYRALFPGTQLSKETQGAEMWRTTSNGGMLAAGVGGPITGKGAHVLIIDDPVKNSEEAESELIRQSHWDWYTTTAYTRLAPGGGVLVIQTRWHDDDLSGRLETRMKTKEGDAFEIVRYPAVAEADEDSRSKGEALHPARYPIEALDRIKRTVGPRVWSSLYQQNPQPEEGAFFREEDFRYYDGALPPKLTPFQAGDLAIGKKEVNDRTVLGIGALDPDGNLWIPDVQMGRWDAKEISDEVIAQYQKYNPQVTGLEKSHIQMTMGPFLEERIRRQKLWGLHIVELPTGNRDKQTRARTLQGLMRQGKVFFPRDAAWVEEAKFELKRFPTGKHDDIVDCLAWLALMIDQVGSPTWPVDKKRGSSWRDKLKSLMTGASAGSHMSS